MINLGNGAKRLIGNILFYLSWPVMAMGAVLFVMNIFIYSFTNTRSVTSFLNSLLMVGGGFLFRIIGEKLRNIRW